MHRQVETLQVGRTLLCQHLQIADPPRMVSWAARDITMCFCCLGAITLASSQMVRSLIPAMNAANHSHSRSGQNAWLLSSNSRAGIISI